MSTPATLEAQRVAPWRTRPGWGINVDLTPPEVLEERAIARLRRLLGSGLLVILVVLGVAFVLAARHHSAAETALAQEEATQVQLRREADSYSDISQMQVDLSRLQGQIATLMGSDVRFDLLAGDLVGGLPAGMKLTTQSITINAAGAAGAASGTDGTGAATGTAGTGAAIGSVSLAGTGRALDDVAAYVEALQGVEGVTDVVPTSNMINKEGVAFTITLNLTDALLSHRYDVGADTGSTP